MELKANVKVWARRIVAVKHFFSGRYLVGVKTSAKIPKGSLANDCRIGNAKAAVLPLPVFALAITSFPNELRIRGDVEAQLSLPLASP